MQHTFMTLNSSILINDKSVDGLAIGYLLI